MILLFYCFTAINENFLHLPLVSLKEDYDHFTQEFKKGKEASTVRSQSIRELKLSLHHDGIVYSKSERLI